jgi:hypothetical protein
MGAIESKQEAKDAKVTELVRGVEKSGYSIEKKVWACRILQPCIQFMPKGLRDAG